MIKNILNDFKFKRIFVSGANGFTNAAGTGPVAGMDKRLFGVTDDLLSQESISKRYKSLLCCMFNYKVIE